MAILDNKLVLSQDQAVTTATTASTNVIDTGVGSNWFGSAVPADYGEGGDLWLNILCTTTTASAGASTVTFALQDSADNASFADTAVKTGAIGKATLVAGYTVLRVPLPPDLRRYIRVAYTVATADLTAGKFSAFITKGSETPKG